MDFQRIIINYRSLLRAKSVIETGGGALGDDINIHFYSVANIVENDISVFCFHITSKSPHGMANEQLSRNINMFLSVYSFTLTEHAPKERGKWCIFFFFFSILKCQKTSAFIRTCITEQLLLALDMLGRDGVNFSWSDIDC